MPNEPVQLRSNKPAEDELIDGGTVEGFKDLEFHEAKHRADTARWLAYLFVLLLAASVLAHYVATVLLEIYGRTSATEKLSGIFNSWLPVISSLVSAAATYYFTKEKS
jgi:hypothetical protein